MSATEILKRVEHYASSHHLFFSGERYLVALSGGADSVALLCILQAMGVPVEAAHCNFHLRGDESDRDEQFCVKLCNQRDVILHRVHFDTQAYAKLHHVSIEMAARRLRYHYFAQLVHDIQAKAVCVAHHRDDSVETLMLNLLRGTGIHGLTGIRPISHQAEQDGVGEIDIVRPLLCLSRVDIESYLSSLGQSFVTDSTNLVPDAALRNRIRLQLLPLMNDIVPSATE
ncbi:MAG: tRNA lysidine(34) synthetase TilS, partial [Prevotella sp.]|nr:tRNA lysidine(34) synthetase TilS [Prevotella sp.]